MKSLWSVVGSVDLPIKITINDVLDIVSDCLNVSVKDIKQKGGSEKYVTARKMCAYFCIKYVSKAPWVAIGHAIRKDHSTVGFYKKAVENMIFTNDSKYVGHIECIDDKLVQMKWSNDYYSKNPETVEINSL